VLNRATYLDAFHHDAAALAAAARAAGMDAPIPLCPGWTMSVLLTHLAGIYAHRTALVRRHARENVVTSFADLDLPSAYEEWFAAEFDEGEQDQKPALPVPAGLLDLFEQTVSTLEDVLYASPPEEPVWTWWPTDQTAGFWQRRMAQETAVHRWDAQLAAGSPNPIGPILAADGIDEALTVMAPASHHWSPDFRKGAGESYHVHCTDTPGEWVVRFQGDDVTVTREHAKADVALRGGASDLLLFLWRRIPADRLDVVGDKALLDRFFELAPTD